MRLILIEQKIIYLFNKITSIKNKNHDFKNVKRRIYTYIQAKMNELIYFYFFL